MLSEPDLLRLNVLMSQTLQAVRINESYMQLEALTEQGEARVPLHTNGRAEPYFKEVRAWLSTQVLGSPGGYPLYIRRWTRMGQARDGSLERLLLLGDPEAVAAVVHAPGLTEELARRAWWIEPRADYARRMLDSPEVASSPLSTTLAEFLLEYLPFEEEPRDVVISMRQLLRHGQLADAQRQDLWRRARRQSVYAAGFLAAGASCIPQEHAAHPKHDDIRAQICSDGEPGPLASRLLWVLSSKGQNFLTTIRLALRRPPNQDVIVAIFNAIGHGCFLPETPTAFRSFAELEADANRVPDKEAWESDASLRPMRHSILCLARVGEGLLDPIFGITDAVGSVMRKRIEPVVQALMAHVDELSNNE